MATERKRKKERQQNEPQKKRQLPSSFIISAFFLFLAPFAWKVADNHVTVKTVTQYAFEKKTKRAAACPMRAIIRREKSRTAARAPPSPPSPCARALSQHLRAWASDGYPPLCHISIQQELSKDSTRAAISSGSCAIQRRQPHNHRAPALPAIKKRPCADTPAPSGSHRGG